MKKILTVFAALFFLSCSSDDATAVRRVSFKADGIQKVYEDIEVISNLDTSFEEPFYRLDISAKPADGIPETFGLRVIRGYELDGQSTNGGAYINGHGYHFDFERPITMHLSINTDKRMKGTFEGVLVDMNSGEDIQITDGKIDITYFPDNPQSIKK